MTDAALLRARIAALRLSASVELEKMSRWPAGAPGSKGGQFAPKSGGAAGGSGKPYKGLFDDPAPKAKKPAAGAGGAAPAAKPQAKPQSHTSGQPAGGSKPVPGNSWGKPLPSFSAGNAKPHYPNATTHPQKGPDGKPITINEPHKATGKDTWDDAGKTATFTPGGEAPAALHGVPFGRWTDAPTTADGWQNVKGQMKGLDDDWPLEVPKGKRPAAGVIVEEPDGRIWLVHPTNGFGGYKATFPKGGQEDRIPSLQANAIKEAWEESGLRVEITGVLGDVERSTSVARYYTARRVGGTPRDMGWETQAVSLVPRSKLKDALNQKVDKDIADDLDILGHGVGKALVDRMGLFQARMALLVAKAGKVRSNSDQPRWPAGTPLGGQWKAQGSGGMTRPPTLAGGLEGKNAAYQKKANAIYGAAKAGDGAALEQFVAAQKAKVDAAAGKTTKTSHDKWNAQLLQYAEQLHADHKASASAGLPGGTSTAPAAEAHGPMKLSSMKHAGKKPGGSADGAIYTDASGQKWLVKGYKNDAMAQNEVLAARLYNAVGVEAPEMRLVELGDKHGGGIGVASKWVEEKFQKLDPANPVHLAAMQKGMATDAWLANWDAVGMSFDNAVVTASGKAVRIDPGGSLLFRAMGTPKGAAFGDTVPELSTLRDPAKAPQAAKIFGPMTKSQIALSVAAVAAVDDATIHKMVGEYGPGTAAEKAALAQKLINRKADLLAQAKAMNGDVAAAPAAPAPAVETPKPKAIKTKPASASQPVWAKPDVSLDEMTTAMNQHATQGAKELYLANVLTNSKASPAAQQHAKTLLDGMDAADAAKPKASAAADKPPLPAPPKITALTGAADKAAIPAVQAAYAAGDKAKLAEMLNQGYDSWDHKTHAWAEAAHNALGGSPWVLGQTAAAKPDRQPPAPEATPSVVKPALPNFAAHKLPDTNTNAPSHNAKVAAIQAAAEKGDVAAILAMGYGSNTYGKKQAQLANDALAALGSTETVKAPQLKNAHPAVAGGAKPTAKPESTSSTAKPSAPEPAAAPKAPTFDPSRLPAKPDFANWKGAGQGLSSNPAVNAANDLLVKQLYATAAKGDVAELKSMQFPELNKATGAPTGKFLSIGSHPSQHIKAYHADLIANIQSQLDPAAKPAKVAVQLKGPVSDVLDKAFPTQPLAQVAAAKSKVGRYAVLGKITNVAEVKAMVDTWEKSSMGNGKLDELTYFKASMDGYNALPQVQKQAIKDYTGGSYSSMNKTIMEGKPSSGAQAAIDGLTKASVPLKPGTQMSRKFSVSAAEQDKILNGQGIVLQESAVTSAAIDPSTWMGNVQLRMTVGEGVKGLYVGHGTPGGGTISNHPNEKEMIFHPNTRYVVLGASKTKPTDWFPGYKGTHDLYVDVLVLPN